jgi:hypothetical protein
MPKGTQRAIELQFPLKGVNRRLAYASQPPFSTPDALNVRPDQTLEGRAPGGSRPGLSKAYYEILGVGSAVRLLNSVTITDSSGFDFWSDDFQGTTLGSQWSTASWLTYSPAILPKAASSVVYNAEVGCVRDALSALNTSQSYLLEIYVTPWAGQHHGKYRIYARMNNSNPALTTDGVVAELNHTGATGNYTGSLTVYVAGVATTTAFTPGSIGSAQGGWFRMLIAGNNVSCTWMGTSVLGSTAVGAPAGARFGFGMHCTVDGGKTLVDTFRVQYYRTGNNERTRTLLVASAGGTVYKESWIGQLTAVSSNLTLASDRQLQSAEYLQKLYIADCSAPLASGTDGVIGGVGNDELSAASIPDCSALGANIYDYRVVLSNTTGSTAGTYAITSIQAAHVHLSPAPGAGTGTYRLERSPKIYDPVANTLTAWTATVSAGQVPSGCPSIAAWADRLVLAGAPVAPHVWYMSKKTDPLDWNYSPTDPTDPARAVAGTDDAMGSIGHPITALIPHSDDYLIMASPSTLKVMRGDPAYGGMFNLLSPNVGAIGLKSWCHGPNGELVVLTRDGIYIVPPGLGYPQSLSRELMPQEMLDVDPTLYTVLMEYDIRFRGVNIFLTPVSPRAHTNWWLNWETKSFWPEQYQTTHEPTALFNYVADSAEDSAVLIGGSDGYIRRHRRINETDESYEITSYVLYGPFRGWDVFNDGILSELVATMSEGSGRITWAVLYGRSPEAAITSTARHTGTWSVKTDGGRQYSTRPRARGGAMLLKLENADTNRRWGIEQVMAILDFAGRSR